MIARREHPEQSGKYVYVPLRMAEDGTWEPLVGQEGFFHHAMDAGKWCAEQLRRRFVEIAKEARLLRALCEHPQFDFDADGIDSEMVRERARALSRLVVGEVDNVARLLSEPRADDDIVIGGVAFDVDEEEEVIEPRLGERPRYRPLAGTAWAQAAAAPARAAQGSPEAQLTAARGYLALGEQIVADAISAVEAFRNLAVAGARPGAPIAQARRRSTPATGAAAPGGGLPDALGAWLTAARTYLHLTEQHIVDAISSVVALREQYETACQVAEAGADAGSGVAAPGEEDEEGGGEG